LRTLR